jgi:hypothetical protein
VESSTRCPSDSEGRSGTAAIRPERCSCTPGAVTPERWPLRWTTSATARCRGDACRRLRPRLSTSLSPPAAPCIGTGWASARRPALSRNWTKRDQLAAHTRVVRRGGTDRLHPATARDRLALVHHSQKRNYHPGAQALAVGESDVLASDRAPRGSTRLGLENSHLTGDVSVARCGCPKVAPQLSLPSSIETESFPGTS